MDLLSAILEIAEKQKTFSTSDVLSATSNQYTRQYIAKTLKHLVQSGKLVKAGSTKQSVYALPQNTLWLSPSVDITLENHQLEEDQVLDRLKLQIAGYNQLPPNVDRNFSYSFLEILNNAIEHSQSASIRLQVNITQNQIDFAITDYGIGLFANIMSKKNLDSEISAIQDLLKGKTTTAKESHSGEGIFFVSKIADLFVIESHSHRLRIDNRLPDTFVEHLLKSFSGTLVRWQISNSSSKSLSELFSSYQSSHDTYKFDKTSVLVRLYTLDTAYISRSQARRLLSGLDQFTQITLDFDRVQTVGQAFADEIFRIFQFQHPKILITVLNTNPEIDLMIKHVSMVK